MNMMRGCNKLFLLISISEIIIFAVLILSINSISDLEERIKTILYVIGAFATTIITTFLVYHNFRQEPELGFIGFLITPEPIDIVKDEYLEYVKEVKQVKHCYSRKFLGELLWVKTVKCNKPPKYLRIANDITNLGFHETKVHEIQFEQTYPKPEKCKPKKLIKPIGKTLIHQERYPKDVCFPLEFYEGEYSELKNLIQTEGRLYRLKFSCVGATKHCQKQVWLSISEDMKTIEWSESRFKKLIEW